MESAIQATRYVSVPQAAKILGVSRHTALRLVQEGRLPAINVGTQGTNNWRINPEHIEDALRGPASSTAAEDEPAKPKRKKPTRQWV